MAMEARGTRAGGIERQGPDGLRMRLGSGPDAAAEARRAIASLRADLDPPLMETLRLLVTELITNSVRHTDCQGLTLRIAVGKSAVLTEVADDGPTFDLEPYEDENGRASDPDTGWGLFLVQRLARDWGVKEEGRSKRVWFELGRA
jgi:anti-sigma regulatory factor (Ser/Thr protein kinase)